MVDLREHKSLSLLYRHSSEVCKVKSLKDYYFSTGGNDNNLIIFDLRNSKKFLKIFSHNAAIKAIDYDPISNVIVSGGGTLDKKIKIWDFKRLELINEKTTDSQISNLFVNNDQSIVVSNGFASNNIDSWSFKNEKICKNEKYTPHPKRILYLTRNPTHEYLLSGSCEGTINLWKIKNYQKEVFTNSMFNTIR